VFLLLSREGRGKKYCELHGAFVDDEAPEGEPDLRILDADGMSEDETRYRDMADGGVLVAGYSPLFGSMLTGSAFHCASAALMLMNQTLYASPIPDNPHDVRLCASTGPKSLERIQCVSCSCLRENAVIEFRR
jgi:hypothetical protein